MDIYITYTNYLQSHSSHSEILRDNSIYEYSYTYITYCHTYLSAEIDDMDRYREWQ